MNRPTASASRYHAHFSLTDGLLVVELQSSCVATVLMHDVSANPAIICPCLCLTICRPPTGINLEYEESLRMSIYPQVSACSLLWIVTRTLNTDSKFQRVRRVRIVKSPSRKHLRTSNLVVSESLQIQRHQWRRVSMPEKFTRQLNFVLQAICMIRHNDSVSFVILYVSSMS
jgi:hypothetical protein